MLLRVSNHWLTIQLKCEGPYSKLSQLCDVVWPLYFVFSDIYLTPDKVRLHQWSQLITQDFRDLFQKWSLMRTLLVLVLLWSEESYDELSTHKLLFHQIQPSFHRICICKVGLWSWKTNHRKSSENQFNPYSYNFFRGNH